MNDAPPDYDDDAPPLPLALYALVVAAILALLLLVLTVSR